MNYAAFRDEGLREKPGWVSQRKYVNVHAIVTQELAPYAAGVYGGQEKRYQRQMAATVCRRVRGRCKCSIIGAIFIGVIVRMIVYWIIKWIEKNKKKKFYTSGEQVHEEFRGWAKEITETEPTS